MINHEYRYIKKIVDGEKFLKDTNNHYAFVGQQRYKGKYDENGQEVVPKGVKVTLQIIEDLSEPVIDKESGMVKDNNELQTFDATIIGADYPLPFTKGEEVSLGDFLQDISYYIQFNLILRFGNIFKYKGE